MMRPIPHFRFLNRFVWVASLALLCLGSQGSGVATPLDDYVDEADSSYAYSVASTFSVSGCTVTVYDMKSQSWLRGTDVDRTLWEHWLVVCVPPGVTETESLMWIGGGSNGGSAPTSMDSMLVQAALATNSIVSEIQMIPNQRLHFAGESDPLYITDGRSEDELIAYCWDKYKTTGNAEWLPRLPMTKAVVRAMDTIQSEDSELAGVDVTEFMVAGGSKRGWTTWTTGAVDPRVKAIAPVVIDCLNVQKSFEHHWAAYGYWADAVGDYVRMGIMDWIDTQTFQDMMDVVDPYSYRDRLTMPKFIVNSTGDQFFLPDSSQFYYDDLVGEKHLRYVPNTDHGLNDEAALNFITYYYAYLNGIERPEFTWTKESDGSLRVEAEDMPTTVRLWQATNPDARNFRLDSIGAAWTSSTVTSQGSGVYVGSVSEPASGWTAFFLELEFNSGLQGYPFKFTTEVSVIPDVLPYAEEEEGEEEGEGAEEGEAEGEEEEGEGEEEGETEGEGEEGEGEVEGEGEELPEGETVEGEVPCVDTEAPVARCRNATLNLSALGSIVVTGAMVDDGSSDDCGIVRYVVSPNTFTCEELGDNDVTLTVWDAVGNNDSCTAVVTILDPLNTCGLAEEGEAEVEGETAEGEGEETEEGEEEGEMTEGESEAEAEGEIAEGEGEIEEGEGEVAEGEGAAEGEAEGEGTEGETSSRLAMLRASLLAQFTALDTDENGALSMAEALARFSDLSQEEFNSLDADGNHSLSREDLGGTDETSQGCFATPSKSGFRHYLGDLLMLGLSLGVLGAFTRQRGKLS